MAAGWEGNILAIPRFLNGFQLAFGENTQKERLFWPPTQQLAPLFAMLGLAFLTSGLLFLGLIVARLQLRVETY